MGWTPPLPEGHVSAKLEFPHYRFRKKESVMKLIRVGVDLAKNVFQLHGVDRSEKTIWRRKLVLRTVESA